MSEHIENAVRIYIATISENLAMLNEEKTVSNKMLGVHIIAAMSQGFIMLANVLIDLMSVSVVPKEELH